ncbi:hypothetical protein BST61_g8703 [Cercospora zeina]
MSNFTDYSQSVNTLINSCPQGSEAHTLPLSAPTFDSLEKFKAGQSQQPPIDFEQLSLWSSCTTVGLRWRTSNTVNETELLPGKRKEEGGEGVRPIVGLIVMDVLPTSSSSSSSSSASASEKGVEDGEIGWKIHTVYSEFDSGAWLQNLKDANICGNPEKNLGAPDANPNSDFASGAVMEGGEGAASPTGAATSRPVKRARMYV